MFLQSNNVKEIRKIWNFNGVTVESKFMSFDNNSVALLYKIGYTQYFYCFIA